MISYVKIMNSGKDTNALKQLGMTTDDWAWTSTAFTVRQLDHFFLPLAE